MKFANLTVVAGLLASSSIIGLSTTAFAQAAADDNGGLQDIIVTAQKREENLQQTPLAISAISGAQLELRGISDAQDLSAIAPNVSVLPGTTNATAAVITIRGIPTPADETQGFDTPIGLYLDGVYLARSSAASFEVADIERVEVLRGPQGTLFGRNTTGGAINFITKKPDDEASLKVKLGYGNYNQKMARVVLNSGTINDMLKMSFGFLHRQRNGVVDNLLQPDKKLDPGGDDTNSIRFAAELDISDSITLTNIFDWTKINAVPHANQLAEVGNGAFRPNVTIGGFTYSQVQPANVAGYLGLATSLEPQCGTPLSNVSLTRKDTICLENAGVSTDKIWGNMTRLDAELGSIKIRSTTAFRHWNNLIRGSDLDGLGTIRGPLFSQASLFNSMPANLIAFVLPPAQAAFAPFIAATPVPTTTQSLFQAQNTRRQKQFSQELELVSDTDGNFQWVLGGFYFKESGYELNPQNFAFILDTNQAVFTAASFGALAPLFQAANPARYRAVVQSSTLGYTVSGQSKAVYGQATYRPGGKDGALGVTLGLRYTWDKKSISRFQNGATAITLPAEIALNNQSAKFSAPTGHLTVDYRASDDINFYGRIARGYRSGGFNARQSTSVANNIALIPFNDETIWSYEVGAKTQFFNRLRLNAAAFYNVYTNQLATIPIPIVGGGSFGTQTVNAGKTIYTGVELEGKFQVTHNFSIDGSFGYVHKNVKAFPGTDIAGVNHFTPGIADVITLGNSPDYTANLGATLNYPVAGANVTARVGWNYVSSQQMFANPLTAPFQQSTKGTARGLFDAQLRIDHITLGGSGEGIGVTFWGKNITDRKYVARGIDFGQLGFGSTIYGDPATYGVSIDFAF